MTTRAAHHPLGLLEGSLVVSDADGPRGVFRVRAGALVRVRAAQDIDRVEALIRVRSAARALVDAEQAAAGQRTEGRARRALIEAYDDLVARFGPVNSPANLDAFAGDPDSCFLASLERCDDAGSWRKGPIFTRRVVAPVLVPERLDSLEQAAGASVLATGVFDIDYVARVLAMGRAQAEEAVTAARLAFRDPDAPDCFIAADEYLSGDITAKLEVARRRSERDSRLAVNVEALELVRPDYVTIEEIDIALSSPWLPASDVEEFVQHLTRIRVRATHSPETVRWELATIEPGGGWAASGERNTEVFGTVRMPALRIVRCLLNQKRPTVSTDGRVDAAETAAAREAACRIEAEFNTWVRDDPGRARRLARLYNDRFVRFRDRVYSDAAWEFTPPGLNPEWAAMMDAHQRQSIRRIASGENALIAKPAGSGKTAILLAGGMEMKRLGRTPRPIYVVKNGTFGQVVRTFHEMYPAARLLAIPPAELRGPGMKTLFERAEAGGYDAIVIAHSSFARIELSRRGRVQMLRCDQDRFRRALEEESALLEPRAVRLKGLHARIDEIDARIAAVLSTRERDLTFERLRPTAIILDECPAVKNAPVLDARMAAAAGVDNALARRAESMLEKTAYVSAVRGREGGNVFLSASPVDKWKHLLVYQLNLQPERLRSLGLDRTAAWTGMFMRTATEVEKPHAGPAKLRSRLVQFVNVPELRGILGSVLDYKSASELAIRTPKLITGKPIVVECPMSEVQLEQLRRLEERAGRIAAEGRRNPNSVRALTMDARKLALDERFLEPDAAENESGKAAKVAENAASIHAETADRHLTQVIFCNLGVVDGSMDFCIYDAIRARLVAAGVPPGEIAYAQNAKSPDEKAALARRIDRGEIRILIASTETGGEGLNFQKLLIAQHNLHPPRTPGEWVQQRGRIERRGNLNPRVYQFNYVAVDRENGNSPDAVQFDACKRSARTIEHFLANRSGRQADAVGKQSAEFAALTAIAKNNPAGHEHLVTEGAIAELSEERAEYLRHREIIRTELARELPMRLAELAIEATRAEADGAAYAAAERIGIPFVVEIGGARLRNRERAGAALLARLQTAEVRPGSRPEIVGQLGPFQLAAVGTAHGPVAALVGVPTPHGSSLRRIPLKRKPATIIAALEAEYRSTMERPGALAAEIDALRGVAREREDALRTPFPKAAELARLEQRKAVLDAELRIGPAATTLRLSADERAGSTQTRPTKYRHNRMDVWVVAADVTTRTPGYQSLLDTARLLGGGLQPGARPGETLFWLPTETAANLVGAVFDLRTGERRPYTLGDDAETSRRLSTGEISVGEMRLRFDWLASTLDAFRQQVRDGVERELGPAGDGGPATDVRVRAAIRRFGLGTPSAAATDDLVEEVRTGLAAATQAQVDRMAVRTTGTPTAVGSSSAEPARDGIRLVKKQVDISIA